MLKKHHILLMLYRRRRGEQYSSSSSIVREQWNTGRGHQSLVVQWLVWFGLVSGALYIPWAGVAFSVLGCLWESGSWF